MSPPSPLFTEYRCSCGKLLFKGLLIVSLVEIKCHRCGAVSVTEALSGPPDSSASFTLLFDLTGSILHASPKALDALGYSMEELSLMRISEVNPSIIAPFYRRLWVARERNDTLGVRRRTLFRAKSGKFIEASTKLAFFENEGRPVLLSTIDTATPPAAMVSVFDGAWFGERPDEVSFEVDQHGHCTWVSDNAETSLGFAPTYLTGKPFADFFSVLQKDSVHDSINMTFKHKDGHIIPLESYFVPSYEHGTFAGQRIFSWVVER